MASKQSGKGGLERRVGRGVDKPLDGLLRDFLSGTKRHALYWIASLWVVATQVRAFDLRVEWLPRTLLDTWAIHGGEG
jgi:hypothetical protein